MAISFDRKCKCGYPLTGKQRMYCSRLCNHKAAWARRSTKVKTQVELLKAAEQRIQALDDAEFSATTQEIIAESSPTPTCTQMIGFGELCGNALPCTHYMPPPSLWRRLRKRVGDVVATIKYLITTSIEEYP